MLDRPGHNGPTVGHARNNSRFLSTPAANRETRRRSLKARRELNRRDGYDLTPEEEAGRAAGAGLGVLFLIDRDGIIRWRWIEAITRPQDLGTVPAEAEILKAVRTVVSGVPS